MKRDSSLTRETIKTLLEQGKYPAQIGRELGKTRQAIHHHIRKIHLEGKEKILKKNSKNPIIDWSRYNDTLVKSGELVFDLLLDRQIIEKEKQWLAEVNNKKVGAPFRYSDGLIKLILTVKTLFKLDYRKIEGMLQKLLSALELPLPCPHYTTIWRRAQKLESEIITFISQKEENKNKEIVLDSTGRSQQMRGNYKETKYKDKPRRFIKVHVSLNVSTGQVEASIPTEENVADVRKAPELIKKSSKNGKPDKAYMDRAYDCAKFRGQLLKNGIIPIIRPKITKKPDQAKAELEKIIKEYIEFSGRKEIAPEKLELLKKEHPTILGKINRLTTMIECAENYEEWSSRNKYGKRAYIENLFSRETLIFGDKIRVKKIQAAEKELSIRYTLLNAFITLAKTKTETEHRSVYNFILNRIKESFYKINPSTKQLEVNYPSFT